LYLYYGEKLFEHFQFKPIWNEIIEYLKKWKVSIPDLPEINFDSNFNDTFNEIKDLSPSIFRKLFKNDDIFNEIVLTIFPQKKTLEMLRDYFNTKNEKIYKTLYTSLNEKIDN